MSEKKRRDITLGEMQDECKVTNHSDCINGVCPYYRFCAFRSAREVMPKYLDLTDPPRFNEAQMALLKIFRKRGFLYIANGTSRDTLSEVVCEFLGLRDGESIDLIKELGA